MMGDKIATAKGSVTGRRVLPNPGGPKMETTFQAAGKLLGVDYTEVGTYWSAMRPDGTLYGEGNGIIMGKRGESATWIGQGVGILKRGGGASFRGAVYFQSNSPRWRRLGKVAAIYEHDVDAQGNATNTLWEWK